MDVAEQQAVFQQHQAQVVGGMAGRVNYFERMSQIALRP